MTRFNAWILIAAGLVIDAAVFALPMTPYPLVHMALDSKALAARRAYDNLVNTGILTYGDPGFVQMRRQYMRGVAEGILPGFEVEELPGLTIERFQVDDTPGDDAGRYTFIIFSNGVGHRMSNEKLKMMYGTFQRPYAAVANLALLILGSAMIYAGLSRLTGISESRGPASGNARKGNALSAPVRS